VIRFKPVVKRVDPKNDKRGKSLALAKQTYPSAQKPELEKKIAARASVTWCLIVTLVIDRRGPPLKFPSQC